jgi:protein ATS1
VNGRRGELRLVKLAAAATRYRSKRLLSSSFMLLVSAGSNAQGQLATGDCEDTHGFIHCRFQECEPGHFPGGTESVVQIAFGSNHTVLLLDRAQGTSTALKRELWGSGDGSKHQLGLSVEESTPVFVPLDIGLAQLGLQDYRLKLVAACWETSYIVLEHPERSDVLLSMGSDDFGDLGIGGLNRTSKPSTQIHQVEIDQDCTASAHPLSVRIVSLVSGPHHVIARLSIELADHTVQERLVGWGTSRHGQLGELKNVETGRPLVFVNSPTFVSLATHSSFTTFALGNQHSVFLSSGRVLGLGSGRRGQLTGLEHLRDVSAVDCTWNGTYAVVRSDGTWSIISTGANHKGQLGRHTPELQDGKDIITPGPVDFPFTSTTYELVKISCGSEHVLCLFSVRDLPHRGPVRREVWAWGWNEHGTLGTGDTEDRSLPVKVWPVEAGSPEAIDIAAGYGNSWIVVAE